MKAKCCLYQIVASMSLVMLLVVLILFCHLTYFTPSHLPRHRPPPLPPVEFFSKKDSSGKNSTSQPAGESNLSACSRVDGVLKSCVSVRESIFVNEAKQILYCPIPKVASTSVKLALVRASKKIRGGYDVHNWKEMDKAGFVLLQKFIKHRKKSNFHEFFKLIIVRHPYERLLSAYLDKFILKNKWTSYFRRKFGSYIISKYRKSKDSNSNNNNNNVNNRDVTFREFAEFVTDERVPCRLRMNPHWAPYHVLCRTCSIGYTYVVHFENLSSSLNAFWSDAFGRPLNDSNWSWEHKGPFDTKNLLDEYMSTLSYSLKERLHKLYELDFRIFGYENVST